MFHTECAVCFHGAKVPCRNTSAEFACGFPATLPTSAVHQTRSTPQSHVQGRARGVALASVCRQPAFATRAPSICPTHCGLSSQRRRLHTSAVEASAADFNLGVVGNGRDRKGTSNGGVGKSRVAAESGAAPIKFDPVTAKKISSSASRGPMTVDNGAPYDPIKVTRNSPGDSWDTTNNFKINSDAKVIGTQQAATATRASNGCDVLISPGLSTSMPARALGMPTSPSGANVVPTREVAEARFPSTGSTRAVMPPRRTERQMATRTSALMRRMTEAGRNGRYTARLV